MYIYIHFGYILTMDIQIHFNVSSALFQRWKMRERKYRASIGPFALSPFFFPSFFKILILDNFQDFLCSDVVG